MQCRGQESELPALPKKDALPPPEYLDRVRIVAVLRIRDQFKMPGIPATAKSYRVCSIMLNPWDSEALLEYAFAIIQRMLLQVIFLVHSVTRGGARAIYDAAKSSRRELLWFDS
jgi:hypothetical protein